MSRADPRFRGEDVDADPDDLAPEASTPPEKPVEKPSPSGHGRTLVFPPELAPVNQNLSVFGSFDPEYRPKPRPITVAIPEGSKYAPRRRLYVGSSVTVAPST
jgi:hypothetical protein